MQLATRQGGLEHIARIHGAFGLARAHHGVQLVNKNNGLAFVLGQVFEHIFQALFKLAAKLGPRQERGHVQRQHALALERIGHFTGHDALGQPLNNRGFSHTGLTNEHRVVLGAALQHLNSAADFVVAPNHRVKLAHAGALGQVHAVFLQGFALLFGISTVHVLPAPHGHNGCVQAFARQAKGLYLFCKVRFGIAQGQHEQLTRHKLVAPLDRLFFRCLQEADHVAPHLHLFLALHFGQFFHGSVGCSQQRLRIDPGALQQGLGAVFLAQHGSHHVGGLDIGVVLTQGRALGVRQGFLEFGGQFV